MTFSFREATSGDHEIITEFNCRLAVETENKTLLRETVLNGVRRGLNMSAEATYFVAEHENRVIGQLMITREWSDWRDGWMVWIQSVYVAADFRGQGVFRGLFEFVQQRMEQQGDVVMIRLYVEQENATAISTYQRLGFDDPGYRVMELPL